MALIFESVERYTEIACVASDDGPLIINVVAAKI
jgi:hypothetical protein